MDEDANDTLDLALDAARSGVGDTELAIFMTLYDIAVSLRRISGRHRDEQAEPEPE